MSSDAFEKDRHDEIFIYVLLVSLYILYKMYICNIIIYYLCYINHLTLKGCFPLVIVIGFITDTFLNEANHSVKQLSILIKDYRIYPAAFFL